MQKKENITRNVFFKKLAAAFSIFSGTGILFAYTGTLKHFFLHSKIYRVALIDIKAGIYNASRFFILKKDKNITVLSKKCPHLGCILQINKHNNAIVCPCHGSRFQLSGKFISGPAGRDMNILNYKIDSQKNIIIETEL